MTEAFEFHPNPAEVAPSNPNTCENLAVSILKWIAMGALIVGALCITFTPAKADDVEPDHSGHRAQDLPIHQLFYKDWNRLDTDTSCCNLNDCMPTPMIMGRDGNWYALRPHKVRELDALVAAGREALLPRLVFEDFDGLLSQTTESFQSWIKVPPHLLEQNAMVPGIGVQYPRDPRDSPDGRSHACINGGAVLCAVLGAAQ